MGANIAKGLSYAEAWRRINAAYDQGFYFEVVTLCESILSDRLLSYIIGVDPACRFNTKTPFGNLILKWKKLAKARNEKLPEFINLKLGIPWSSELGDAVDTWRNQRNEVIHGLTKSTPGASTPPVESFITRVKNAAELGRLLARKVSRWHEQMRAHAKEQKGTVTK
jgi:hypothetical protein